MIAIKNIYYMLSYAFQVLNEKGYKNIEAEEFDNAADLCAAILIKGISVQIKRGLIKEYVSRTEQLATVKGKIEVTDTVKAMSLQRQKVVCTHDEFTVDFKLNEILKSTLLVLLRANIAKERKKAIRKLLVYFVDVKEIDLHQVNWNVKYSRNNQQYQMLIAICFFVVKGLLQSDSDGATKVMDFFDEQRMCHLYEKFILEYYRKEFKGRINANASQIPWQLDDGEDSLLPVMQTDISLSRGSQVLIIDAKYYGSMTQSNYDKRTLHSANVYQIFTYVKNKEVELAGVEHTVAGMLLYAKTDEEIVPCNSYMMSGNKISVGALDLNQDFSEIAHTLNAIAIDFFELS